MKPRITDGRGDALPYLFDSSPHLTNEIESNDLLAQIRYPDTVLNVFPPISSPQPVRFEYNRLGEVVEMRDANVTVHAYDRDDLGRVVLDKATVLTGLSEFQIDDRVQAIGTTYDLLGRVERIASYAEPAATTVLNDVEFIYDELWQIVTIKQQHDGEVDIDSPTVGYTYATEPMATGNFSRQTELVYPDGWILETTYGASGSIDARISRAAALRDEDTSDVYAGYAYIGSGTPAIVDYGIPGVRLSRFHADNGTSTTGQYPGFDRFGRIARQLWTDDDFGPHGTLGTVPNKPPIVSLAYTNDNASSRTGAFDARPGSQQPLSHMYAYDGLHRLIDARRGVWNGDLGTPSVTQLKNSQEWSLDALGNWDAVGTASTDAGIDDPDDIETRDHRDAPEGDPENRVNKLMSRTLSTAAGGDELAIDYDFAGNMLRQELTDEPTALVFTNDAWNRLVRVQFEDDDAELHDRGEYEYNGLNWRTVRRFDSDNELDLDTEQVLLYDADWRLLERRINSDYDPEDEEPEIDRIIHHVWGLRYIDDVVATRHDINPSAENGHELIFFHVTDAQFSTVAILNATGALLERVTYTAYGVARHHWLADINGDGAVDGTDLGILTLIYSDIGDAEYRAEADFNRDGAIDSGDLGLMFFGFASALDEGALSGSVVNNEIGYAGYQFAPEAGSLGAYLARNRWLDPELGRWRQRDPLGYVDGMNLYEYVRGRATVGNDPRGLAADDSLPRYPLWDNNGWTVPWSDFEYRWQADDFVDHYYRGLGRAVSLLQTGLLDEFRRHDSVEPAVHAIFRSLLIRLGADFAGLDCEGQMSKTTTAGTAGVRLRPPTGGWQDDPRVPGTVPFRAPYDTTRPIGSALFVLGRGTAIRKRRVSDLDRRMRLLP